MTVLVVGGGPAGSLAALLLARGGARVTLIEQHRFPRDKVCGECLSDLGLQVLERHHLTAGFRRTGRTIVNAVLHGRTGRARLALPSPMLGISRAAMDSLLLSAAADAGVRVRQPARVEAVEARGEAVDVRVRDLADNRVDVETVDWCLLADGRGTFNDSRPAASGDLGIKAHFRNVAASADAVTLYGGVGCYGGVAPIENDRWNVAFAVPRTIVAAARGDLKSVWRKLLASSAALRSDFARAERVTDWLAAPLPRHREPEELRGRVVPTGAAACAIEPVGGEGMGTAIRSAELAAEAVLAGDITTLSAAYAKLWRRRSLFCRVGGLLLSDRWASDAVELASTPVAGRAAMWLIGK